MAAFEAEARKPGILTLTRRRLQTQRDLTHQIVADIDDAIAAALGKEAAIPIEMPRFSPLESLHLLYRDWGWPESDENARGLAAVERVLAAPLGRVLVLGAGACRLAYDLHVQHRATLTVAVDIDPLTLLTAAKIVAGESVTLTEGRSNATEMTRLSASRILSAPQGAVDHFHLLLANGLEPPFVDQSFDTVLTPWFIDLVVPDMRDFLGTVRRLLVPGGQWLNFGPLLYPLQRPAANRFSREELFELMHLAGFSLAKFESQAIPYSHSPLAERGRLETCLAFSARADRTPVDVPGEPPSWIVLPYLPVPDFPGRNAVRHSIVAFRLILDLVDGQRTIDDIATILTEQSGSTHPAIRDTVRHCLIECHPACPSAEAPYHHSGREDKR